MNQVLFRCLLLGMCGGALTQSLARVLGGTRAIDMVYYTVFSSPVSWWWILPGALIGAGAGFLKQSRLLLRVALPLLLLWPLCMVPLFFWVYPVWLILLGWCAWRAGRVWGKKWKIPELSPRAGMIAVFALFLCVFVWYACLQFKAFDVLFLIHGDWGQYAERHLKLAFGAPAAWYEYFVAAGHWNPAANLILSTLFRLAPTPGTVFLLNAALIGSAVLLLYALARKHQLSVAVSLGCAMLGWLNPVLSNQPLSLFYGFHPINLFIPVLLGFFLFRRTGNCAGMAGCLLFSLLIQETVAVFWAGYALYWLCRKEWLRGGVLFFGCLLFFFAVSHWIIPLGMGEPGYSQNFHYAALGGTPVEIILSPLLRPAAFWGTVVQYQNFCFLGALLTPFFFLLRPFSLLPLAGVPLAAGVLLQNSPEVKTVVLQYGVELTLLLSVVAVSNLAKARNTGRFHAVLCATAVTAVGSYLLFGLTPAWGKYSSQRIFKLPSGKNVVEFLNRRIPENGRVLAPNRLRAHFMFTHKTGSIYDARQDGDTLILPLHDGLENRAKLERLRRELWHDRGAHPEAFVNFYSDFFVVYSQGKAPEQRARHRVPGKIPSKQFLNLGEAIPSGDPNFSIRRLRNEAGAFLLLRIENKVDYDVDLLVFLNRDGKIIRRRFAFGDGLFPAWSLPPESVYAVPLKTDAPVAVQLEKR